MSSDLLYAVLKQGAFWIAFLSMYRMEGGVRARSAGSGERDGESKTTIGLSILFGLLLGWTLSALPLARWHSPAVYWWGIGLMVAGVLFRREAIRILGRSFSQYVTIQEGQKLVEAGLYRFVRHPSYTGALIWFVGIGLTFGSVPSLLAVVGLPLLWGYRYRIRVEESVLEQTWGEAYRDYQRRTYRLIPFVW